METGGSERSGRPARAREGTKNERPPSAAAYRERERSPPRRLHKQRAVHFRCEFQRLFGIDDHLQGSVCNAPDVGYRLMEQIKNLPVADVGMMTRRLPHRGLCRARIVIARRRDTRTRPPEGKFRRMSSKWGPSEGAVCKIETDHSTLWGRAFPEMKESRLPRPQAGSASSLHAADCIACSARRDQSSAISTRTVRSYWESMLRAMSRHCAANWRCTSLLSMPHCPLGKNATQRNGRGSCVRERT